jgi:hypothetical protein
MKSSLKKILLLLVVLLALAYALHRSSGMLHSVNFSGPKLLQAVRGANPVLLLFSVVAIYVCFALRSLRWQLFQGNLGSSRFWVIYKMTLAGFTATFLLGRAGEPVRPILLSRKENLPLADMSGIYTLERIFDLVSAAVIAGIALILEQRQVPVAATTGALLIAGVFAGIGFLVYFRVHGTSALEQRLQSWLTSLGWKKKLAEILLGFTRGVQMIRSWGELGLAVIYSAVHWGIILLVYIWISHSFGGQFLEINTGDAMLLMAFTLAGSIFQLPLAGGGSQLAAISVYKFFGIETEPATAAALVLWLITFASCCVMGVPLLIHEGFSLGKLRTMAEHEKIEAAESAAGDKGEAE